jgi:hypothetical protein
LDELNFQIAIAVTDSITGHLKHDPKYVDWLLTVWVVEKGAHKKEHVGGLHPCTENEYLKFYPRAVGA